MNRIELVRGSATPEELAAVVVALTPTAGGELDVPEHAAGAPTPAWTRAALLEGVGGSTVVSAGDLATRTAGSAVLR